MLLVKCLLLLLCMIKMVMAGHFLLWIPMSSKSVKIGVMEVGYELAKRGHEVTVVSPFKSKKEVSGVTDIAIESVFEEMSDKLTEDALLKDGIEMSLSTVVDVSIVNNKNALTSPAVKEILDSKVVDVVVALPVFGNEVAYLVAHKKNASLVLFLTAPVSFSWTNWAIGDIYNPSFIPVVPTGFTQEMTFVQRLINTAVAIVFHFGVRDLYAMPKVHSMLASVFPDEEIPHMNDLIKTASLLINHGSPFLGDGLRPVLPQTIFAGLMSCNPPSPLPQDLEDFVHGAEQGVIYVSFGSVIKASKMPEAKRQLLINVFSHLKQRIIWKWEAPMPDAPENVMISSWLPQTSLLAHENVKLFITHGGAGSIQETICHKTPIVAVPIMGDQFVNAKIAAQKNFGVLLKWHGVTEDSLKTAIEDVLSNPNYKEAVSELRDLIMDQPQHPLDRAAWWMEYLLRHPHNPGMRNPAQKLYWFQYFLLDVILVFVVTFVIIVLVVRKIVKYCRGEKIKTE
eukprot:GFUD01024519.1.p1 GENE.GFUD01024519.1~~GFUD01024519.1.p1  ORF type:complete len:510 (+),score=97.85 GFUD01024519.1:201-1730(+)